jgi:hypothetical protein
MSRFGWFVLVATSSLVPLISLSYVFFRLTSREKQLLSLFSLPRILLAYLRSKGVDVRREPGETNEDLIKRKELNKKFRQIFDDEYKSEYSRVHYLVAIFVGSFFTGLIVYYLGHSSICSFLISPETAPPSPAEVALLGAFTWNLWLLLSGYDSLDLIPSTFLWIPFRYAIAIISGLISSYIFKEAVPAILFALTLTILPNSRLLEFLRSHITALEKPHAGKPPVWKIQGMQQSTVDRLETLGIHTTQELAYFDPLFLLFRTNFQPKVVIDWIDQAMLYDYVEEHVDDLRKRGIRGSIELSGLTDNDPAVEHVAKSLGIKTSELKYLRNKLQNDYQVKLISELWDEFKPPDQPKDGVQVPLAPMAGGQTAITDSRADTA